MVVALLSGATLSGCVQAREDRDTPPEPPVCAYPEGFGDRAYACCDDCPCGPWGCATAPTPSPTPGPWRPRPPSPSPCFVSNASGRFSDPWIEPATVVCDPPAPATFLPFFERHLRECAACAEVAIAVEGERILLATTEGLDVLSRSGQLHAPAPVPFPVATTWTLRSPAVASDGRDVWFAAIARQPLPPGLAPVDALVVARWDGASGWLRSDVLGLDVLPDPTAAHRVQLAPTRDGMAALVEAQGAAWSFRLDDPAAFPQPFALPDARVRLGAVTRDSEGRALVPYARSSVAGGAETLGLATLPDLGSAWSHTQVVDAGVGVSPHALPALESPSDLSSDAPMAAVAWIDALGRLVRATTSDMMAWSDPAPWRPDGMATSSPAAGHDGRRATLAWAEDDRVVLARGSYAPDGTIEMESDARSAPALALQRDRAVVAWLAPEGGLVVAVEGELTLRPVEH